MEFPRLKNIFSSGTKGLVEGITDGAANIISKLKADPTKVMEAEKELEQLRVNAELRRLELSIEAEKVAQEETKSYLADVADSRNANVKIQESDKASWLAKNIAYLIDAFVILLWGILTIYLIASALKLIKTTQVDLTGIYGLYAAVTGVATTIITFHRGSSMGSQLKQKKLDELMNNKPNQEG